MLDTTTHSYSAAGWRGFRWPSAPPVTARWRSSNEKLLGGTCLNRGCIPTKTMIASAGVAHQVRRAAEFGVNVGAPTVDLGAVIDRKDRIVESIRSGSYRAVEGSGGIDFFVDEARLIGHRRWRVGDAELEADRIFLSTPA